MVIDRSGRTVFEAVAELYAEARPGYPAESVDEILRLSVIAPEGRIQEIGCSSGDALAALGQCSAHMPAVELAPRLAAPWPRLRRRLLFERIPRSQPAPFGAQRL